MDKWLEYREPGAERSIPTAPPSTGFYFLHYLQTLVGGPEVFEAFFKDYIKAFSFKTVTSDGFKVLRQLIGMGGEAMRAGAPC